MIFGELPLDEVEGAILAHSVQTTDGRLRKGLVLGAAHVAQLRAASISHVMVARLEDGDVGEDEAAARLAAALASDPAAAGLRLSKPFTGRVNLLAGQPGVVMLDESVVARINAIDPMITFATVPLFQQMVTGGMVGTVKIISYGVAEAALQEAEWLARGADLMMAPVVLGRVSLIVTEVAGGAGEKGVPAIAQRVGALGMDLAEVLVIPHTIEALAETIGKTVGDLVLILTGSATSDPRDVAPQALRQAGGEITRFGMPVDPGNLLFLGSVGARPVIGLPGCARSPALNGTDWVLSRVACGIDVSSADIAAMAVGGLLKEIPTRPMPRRGKSVSRGG